MSSLTILQMQDGRVSRNPIVPHHNSPRRPLESTLDVLTKGHVVIEELEKTIPLFLFEAHDITSELQVDKESFFSRDRMGANNWMGGSNWFPSDYTTSLSAGVGLLMAGMNSLQSMQSLSKLGRQAIVCLSLDQEKSISTGRGTVKKV